MSNDKATAGEPVLPLHETEAMHDAVMQVLYSGRIGRGETDRLWQAYRKVLVEAQPATQQVLPFSEAAIDAFLEDYELMGEDEDGRDGCYKPTETERGLIKDAIIGFLSEAQPATQPCRSPYCECEPGKCTHPGFHDARHEPMPIAGWKVKVRGTDQALPVVGVYDDTVFVHVAQPTCVAIIEVFDREWHMKYLSLPVGTHKLYPQQYTFTATPQPRKLTEAEVDNIVMRHMADINSPEGNPVRKLNAYRALVRAGESGGQA